MGYGGRRVKDSGGLSAWNDDPKDEVKDTAKRARRARDKAVIDEELATLDDANDGEDDDPEPCRWCNGPQKRIADGTPFCPHCEPRSWEIRRVSLV